MPDRITEIVKQKCGGEKRDRNLYLEKKNGRATSGDRGGEPTVQVARPLLGDTRWVSGEEIVSATIEESKDCASEKSRRIMDSELRFFLFLRRSMAGSTELGHFPAKIASFASCDRCAACDPERSLFEGCIRGIASSGLHWRIARNAPERIERAAELCARDRRCGYPQRSRARGARLHENVDEQNRCARDPWLRADRRCVTS